MMNTNLDFAKEFHCPEQVTTGDLHRVNSQVLLCKNCSKTIYDLTDLNEKEIISLFKNQPEACALFSFDHPEIKVL